MVKLFIGSHSLRTLPLFIAEISENHIRGRLGSYLVLSLSTGILLAFVAGTYLSFFTVPLVLIILPTVYSVAVCQLPDTPTSLMSRKKPDAALKSLMFYRTHDKNDAVSANTLNDEFELLKQASENKDYEKVVLSDFCEHR